MRESALLARDFYARHAAVVARDLLGMTLRRGGVALRITEVEAYHWPPDTACHGRHGKTARNAVLWGEPGRAYVYLCYGVHHLLNLVTGEAGEASAVLIRACEIVSGEALVRRRRGGKVTGPDLLTGPGKVTQALGIDLAFDGEIVYRRGNLEVREGAPPARILTGPRVGVDYALAEHRDLGWRFAAANTPWVSRPKDLRPAKS